MQLKNLKFPCLDGLSLFLLGLSTFKSAFFLFAENVSGLFKRFIFPGFYPLVWIIGLRQFSRPLGYNANVESPGFIGAPALCYFFV